MPDKFTPCVVCLVVNPLEIYPAITSIDLALREGTLRVLLCEEHNAAAQRLAPLLVRVPEPGRVDPMEQLNGEVVEDGANRD